MKNIHNLGCLRRPNDDNDDNFFKLLKRPVSAKGSTKISNSFTQTKTSKYFETQYKAHVKF